MLLLEQELDVPANGSRRSLLEYLREAVADRLPKGLMPVRFVVTASRTSGYHCEVGAISGLADARRSAPSSVLDSMAVTL